MFGNEFYFFDTSNQAVSDERKRRTQFKCHYDTKNNVFHHKREK